MFGDAIFGDLIFGGGSLLTGDQDPDSPIVIVIIHDPSGRITELHTSRVKVLNELSYVDILSPSRSWVKTLK